MSKTHLNPSPLIRKKNLVVASPCSRVLEIDAARRMTLTAEQLGKGGRRGRQARKKPLNISKHGSALQEDLMQQCGFFTLPSVVPGCIFSPCKHKEALAAMKS